MRLADVIVRCRELTKVYDLYGEEKDRLKALLGLRANVKKFPALRGVTQDFHRGEIVGAGGAERLRQIDAGAYHRGHHPAGFGALRGQRHGQYAGGEHRHE